MQGRALARVALGPLRCEADALLRVRKRLIRVVLGQVAGGPVAEEHVVRRVRLDGLARGWASVTETAVEASKRVAALAHLGEPLDSLVELLGGECRVALGLELGRASACVSHRCRGASEQRAPWEAGQS